MYRYHVFLSHNGALKRWRVQLAESLRKSGLRVSFDDDSIELSPICSPTCTSPANSMYVVSSYIRRGGGDRQDIAEFGELLSYRCQL